MKGLKIAGIAALAVVAILIALILASPRKPMLKNLLLLTGRPPR